MTKVELVKQLWALLFLALAASPFTAPFRTIDTASYEARAVVVAPLIDEDDSGSVVAPLVPKGGRLTLAVPTGLVISYFVPVVGRAPFIPPTSDAHHDSTRPTVLRV